MAKRRGRTGLLGVLALLVFMVVVVYRSLQTAGVRCEVCITYNSRSQCRAVDGSNEEEARMAATTNVCAYLSSGVTDSMACSRTLPTRDECTPLG
jgi:hypothetical protein